MSGPPTKSGLGSRHLPTEAVRREVMTLLFTDLVGSTRLKEDLGNSEALRLIREHHAIVRETLSGIPDGHEISTAGDSFFLAFRRPSDAVTFALRLQSRLAVWNRRNTRPLRDRIGIHAGEVTIETTADGELHDLHGLEVDKCARVMSLGHENHILVTRFAFENARASLKGQTIEGLGAIDWVSHGLYELKGVAEPIEICEVAESGRTALSPPEDGDKARRVAAVDATGTMDVPVGRGWRRWLAGRPVDRRLQRGGALACAVVGVLAVGLFPGLTQLSYDCAYVFRPVRAPADAVIVKMDPESEADLKQSPEHRWDRRLHARLLDRLREYGAKAVVMDVWFDTPSEPAEDDALIQAVRRFTNVVLAGRLTRDARQGFFEQETLQGPFPELASAAHWGISHFPYGLDQVVRVPHPGRPEKAHVAAELASLVEGKPVPMPRNVWLNYYGPPGTIDNHRYTEALTNQAMADRFAGRIVFVGSVNLNQTGYTGGWLNDEAATPYTRWTGRRSAGVELVATTTMNCLHRDWLRRLSGPVEALLLAGVGLAAGLGLTRLRPVPALVTAVAAALLVSTASLALVWPTHVWFPWLVVCAVQLPLALAWAIILWTQASGQRSVGAAGRTAVTGGGAARPTPAAPPPAPTPATPAATPASAAAASIPAIPSYSLLRCIGRGAYGQVWLARDTVGVLRAVKIVRSQDFENARPFDREFEGIRRFVPLSLEHRGLIRVLHVGRDDVGGTFHYVMEIADDAEARPTPTPEQYVPRSLAEDLKRRGHLGAAEVLQLGAEIAEALAFLHQHRLVHRDLKPANILYVRGHPKLGDIGLVTDMAATDRSVTCLGTQGYIAPEGPGTGAADLYGLGKVLYVAATGRPPTEFPELPLDLDERTDRALLLRLHAVWLRVCDPVVSQRPASAEALALELRSLLPPST